MTLSKIFDMGLIQQDTQVWVRDSELHLLTHGNWYQDNILEYMNRELESFTWQNDGNIYIDVM